MSGKILSGSILQVILDNSPDAIIIISQDQKEILYANSACEVISEFPIKDFYKSPLPQMAHPDEMVQGLKDLASVFSGKTSLRRQTRLITKSGKNKWVDSYWTPLKDESGKLLGTLLVVRDISDIKAARDSLEQQEELLHAVLASTADGILAVKNDGMILSTNPRFAKMWEIPDDVLANAVTDNDLISFVIEKLDDPLAFRARIEDIYKRSDEALDEIQLKNGDVYERYTCPLFREGEQYGRVWNFRNVTKRIVTEQALRDSEYRYRSLFEAANDAILLIRGDIFIKCNKKALEIYGCTSEELIGQTPYYFSPEKQPDGRNSRDKAAELIGRVQEGQPQFFEWKHKRYDGSAFDVEVSLNRLDISGESHLLAVVRDISDRKTAEAELRKGQDMINALIETSKDWIWAIDLKGVHTYCNPAVKNILGYMPDELVGNVSLSLLHDEDRKAVESRIPFWIEKRRGWTNLLLRWQHKDGHWCYLESNAVPIFDINKDIVGFRGVDRDITERIKSEEEKKKLEGHLRHAQRMETIGTLAGGIAHDFNNILSTIIGNAEIAVHYELENEHPALQSLTHVLDASNRAKDLVKQILIFSRQMDEEQKQFNITPIIKETTRMVRASLPSTIDIILELESESDTIVADPVKIHQVLMNLFTNAYHAMSSSGGQLKVSLSDAYIDAEDVEIQKLPGPGHYLKIIVSDTGEGMSRQVIERIFEPYFTTKRIGEGTGLGLSVVHGIVKALHGDIKVESKVNVGTAFTIFLPKSSDISESKDINYKALLKGSERILLVDDESGVVNILKKLLEGLGYKVTGETDSEMALEIFRRNPESFDIVITDMTMPKMTGDIMAENMLNIRPDINILMMTGFSEKISKNDAMRIGAKGFLLKPIVIHQLSKTIREIMDN